MPGNGLQGEPGYWLLKFPLHYFEELHIEEMTLPLIFLGIWFTLLSIVLTILFLIFYVLKKIIMYIIRKVLHLKNYEKKKID